MAITRKQKEEIVASLEDSLKSSETVAFVNFHGLSVSDTAAMRSSLKEEGVGYTVAKKTLIKRALDAMKADGELPELPGELALAYGSETAPARTVYEFQEKHDDAVSLLGGIFEGRFLSKEEILEIARIPSLEVLRGMFVNLINSPRQRLAIALSEIAKLGASD